MADTMLEAPGAADADAGPPPPPPTRHRLRNRILAGLAAVVLVAAGLFIYRWRASGVHPLSPETALQRFRSQAARDAPSGGGIKPHAGVYRYTGSGTERVSFPPKTVTEGPVMPGTVTYRADGCWDWRVDFSDSHWESTRYCPAGTGFEETGHSGWMKWDFVAVVVDDTSTFVCDPPQAAVPADIRIGVALPFSCVGSNDHLDTGAVYMKGTSTVLAVEDQEVGGSSVSTVHVRQTATFSGGQSGFNDTDMWIGADGLPVRVTWSTEVRTPSPLGTTTMTGGGSYRLASLEGRS